MTLLSALLHTWNTSNALASCVAFLRDNPEWKVQQLYEYIKMHFMFAPGRVAKISGKNGRLVIQAPAVRNSGCFGACLYR